MGLADNIAIAARERRRRELRAIEDPFYPVISQSPEWDSVFGALHDKEDAANAAGLNFRVNLGSIGRPEAEDDGSGGGLNYFDRESLKYQGQNQLSNAAAQQVRAQDYAQKVAADQQQQQIADDLHRGYDRSRMEQAFAPPPSNDVVTGPAGPPQAGDRYSVRPGAQTPQTPEQVQAQRERALSIMPVSVRPYYEKQWMEQDAAKTAQDIAKGTFALNVQKERAAEGSNPLLGQMGAMVGPDGAPLQGDAVLQRVPPAVRNQVKGILEGRQALPVGTATKDPYWKAIIQIAQQVDPNFDAVNYNARANTRKDFTSGKAAQQINGINTVIGHLSDLAGEGDKLDNYGTDWMNAIRNKLTTGGSKRGVAINNFETLREGVGNELMRVWRQVGAGSEKEIEDWKSTISSAKSPQELQGAFKTIAGMLESKLSALDEQYKQGMGTQSVSAIAPAARQKLDKLQGVATTPAAASGGAVPMFSPDGRPLMVPPGDVDRMLKLGAKKAGG